MKTNLRVMTVCLCAGLALVGLSGCPFLLPLPQDNTDDPQNNGEGENKTSPCNDSTPLTAKCTTVELSLDAQGVATLTPEEVSSSMGYACPEVTLSLSRTEFTCEDVGGQMVALTVTAPSGNSSTCNARVWVRDPLGACSSDTEEEGEGEANLDTTAPTALCKDAAVSLGASGWATLTLMDVDDGSFDERSGVTISLSKTHFSCADVGQQAVQLVVEDASRNASFCTAQVTVTDSMSVCGHGQEGEISWGLKRLIGSVRDTQGNPVPNAQISVEGQTALTDAEGFYVLGEIPGSSALLVQVEADGFTTNSREIDAATPDLPRANFVLKRRAEAVSLDIDSGGTVSDGNGNTLTLPAKSLITKDGKQVIGPVDVSITALNVADPDELNAFPGDFRAIALGQKTGETVFIETFALAEYDVRQNGKKLQMDPAKSGVATIRLKLTQNRLEEGQNVPLWYFNEATGLWEEQGMGTVKAGGLDGLVWEASIPHFSWWNSDKRIPLTDLGCVSGRVVDKSGMPIPGAIIEYRALNRNFITMVRSESDGSFCTEVFCGESSCIRVLGPGGVEAAAGQTFVPVPCGHICPNGIADCVEIPAIETTVRCISGRMLDSNGNPAVGVLVSIYDVDREGLVNNVFTGTDGTYRAWMVCTGSVRIQAYWQVSPTLAMGGEAEVAISADLCEMGGDCIQAPDIEAAPWPCLSGRVLDSDGNPISVAKVSIYDVNLEQLVGEVGCMDDGTYQAWVPCVERVRIEASIMNVSLAEIEVVIPSETCGIGGDCIQAPELLIREDLFESCIEGTFYSVFNATEQIPAPNVPLRFDWGWWLENAVTDESGHFRMPVPPDTLVGIVYYIGNERRCLPVVSPPSNVNCIDVTISPEFRTSKCVSGKILDSRGHPFRPGVVKVIQHPTETGWWDPVYWGFWFEPIPLEPDGAFCTKVVCGSQTSLEAILPGGWGGTFIPLDMIEVEPPFESRCAGWEAILDDECVQLPDYRISFHSCIEGFLYDSYPDPGEPDTPAANVEVMTSLGLSAITDYTGHFQIDVPGGAQLEIYAPGFISESVLSPPDNFGCASVSLTSYSSALRETGGVYMINGSVPLEMVYIPAGTFLMGSPDSEAGRLSNEGPRHRVTFTRGFWMSKYECTREQAEALWPGVARHGDRKVPYANIDTEYLRYFPARPYWYDAGNPFARPSWFFWLPTEAQWEYAYRAGTTTRFPWGDDAQLSQISDFAWWKGNTVSEPNAHLVGSKQPNAWGLYDMGGNVRELCQDTYHPDYGGAPTNGSAWITEVDSPSYVVRGGSWRTEAVRCRSAARGEAQSVTADDIGFRFILN